MQSTSFDAPLPDSLWEDPLDATFIDDIIHNEHLGFGLDSNEQDFFNLSLEKAGKLQTDEGALNDSDELRDIISCLALSDGRGSLPFASKSFPQIEVVPSGVNPDWTRDPFLSSPSNEFWQNRSDGPGTPGTLSSPSTLSQISPSFNPPPLDGFPPNALGISLNDHNHSQDAADIASNPFLVHENITVGLVDISMPNLAVDLARQLAGHGVDQVIIDKMEDVLTQVYLRESGFEQFLQPEDLTVNADTEEQPLPPKLFADFFKTLKKEKDKKQYVCLFCKHQIGNRTQMVQHIMGLHFRYFPFKCAQCPVQFDRKAEFYRKADFKKHVEDKHMGVIHLCGVWYA
ncbi:hypothetical protein FRC17_006091 [Serendipita sp. 399]|nr:hypothetical protein FRC17_006091 [Serendipita sp. 399]